MKILKNRNNNTSGLYLTRFIVAFTFYLILFSCEGEDGETGTTNVIYSEWINKGIEDNINDINTVFTINAPQINAEILNTGTILVYGRSFNTNNGAQVFQLPMTTGVGSERLSYLFKATSGEIEIRINSAKIIGTNDFLLQYRYVIIPGGQISMASLDYSKMSYKEIESMLNIPLK